MRPEAGTDGDEDEDGDERKTNDVVDLCNA